MFLYKLKNNNGKFYKNKKFLLKTKISIKKNFYFNFDFLRIWNTSLSIIIGFKLNILKILLILIKYSTGSLSVIKSSYGLFMGNFIKNIYLPLKLYNINLLGFRIFLKLLKPNMIFFDLGKYKNFNYKNTYSKANGTFSYLVHNNYELHLSLIKLPSNIKKYLTLNYLCTLGRNSNIFNKFIIIR